MKKTQYLTVVIFFLAAVALISFTSVKDNAASIKKASSIADWERAKAYTLEYLSAANDEVISFKPTPEIRSFGQQMLHIAEANYGFGSAAAAKKNPISFGDLEKASDKYKTKEALTQAVMDSYDFIIAAMKELDEAKMDEKFTMFNRFEMSREAGFEKAFEHQTHHRGQTTVYLRLNGIAPPNEKLF